MVDHLSQLIDRLSNEAFEKRQELHDLEASIRTLNRLARANDQAVNGIEKAASLLEPEPALVKDLLNKTIRQAAEAVLREEEEPVPYREVFRKAEARGYRAPVVTDPEKAARSFYMLMSKSDAFVNHGRGRFALAAKKSKGK
jgi:hypothetical protein